MATEKTEVSKRFIKYSDQLKMNDWKRKSAEIKLRDNFSCKYCGTSSLTLTVHHIMYIDGFYAWEYPNNLLITLCMFCHEKDIHGIFKHPEFVPCLCCKCSNPILNKNCSTIGRIGDCFRFDIFCDKCISEVK